MSCAAVVTPRRATIACEPQPSATSTQQSTKKAPEPKVWTVRLVRSKAGPCGIASCPVQLARAHGDERAEGTEIYTAELPASLSSPQLADLLLWFKRSCATPGLGEEFQRGDPRATIRFPACMSDDKRKDLHVLIAGMGLKSGSRDLGAYRHLVVHSACWSPLPPLAPSA